MQGLIASKSCFSLQVKIDRSRKDKEIKRIYNDFINPVRLYYASSIVYIILLLCYIQPCKEAAVTQDVDGVTVLRCDAEEDGKCEGDIEVYKHFHFTCLAANVPGQPSTHNFCKYHYDNAITYCPVHPCFSRTIVTAN